MNYLLFKKYIFVIVKKNYFIILASFINSGFIIFNTEILELQALFSINSGRLHQLI